MNCRPTTVCLPVMVAALTSYGCSQPDLGPIPFACGPDDACPSGYECIADYCLLPGASIPSDLFRISGTVTGDVVDDVTVTLAELGASLSGLDLYRDGLVEPWIDTSWDATVDLASTDEVHSGAVALRVHQHDWGSLRLRSGTHSSGVARDSSDFDVLRLAIFPETGARNIEIRLAGDGTDYPYVPLGDLTPDRWHVVSVPITSLIPEGGEFLVFLLAQRRSGEAVYHLDEIRFEAVEPPTILGTTTTDGSGAYVFAGLPEGDYQVSVDHPSHSFEPAIRLVTVSGADVDYQDFVSAHD